MSHSYSHRVEYNPTPLRDFNVPSCISNFKGTYRRCESACRFASVGQSHVIEGLITCYMALKSKLLISLLSLMIVISCAPVIEQTKPYSQEIKLDVPFEPNLGNTCFSSSFAMVMRYWGKDVHVKDVLNIVGLPPFKGYEHPELNIWMKKNYGLKFLYLPYSRIKDLKLYLNEGYPVIVHQTISLEENTGHNRVVIGYNDRRKVFITNDPSRFGPNYEIPYNEFEKLWERIALYEPGPPNKIYLVVPLKK